MEHDPLSEIAHNCLLMRTRHLSRAIGALFQGALDPFGVSAAQFVLLMIFHQNRGASRARIGRIMDQDRSTLTRNIQGLMSSEWVREACPQMRGRLRQLMVTQAGEDLLRSVIPVWRAAQSEAVRVLGRNAATVISTTANRLMREGLP
ncbi:MAG: MarR family transcriptional regulator [Proteobacteria bacterium]|nr:MarR family transcriptional regulator [Pseudomonadota bacterium]